MKKPLPVLAASVVSGVWLGISLAPQIIIHIFVILSVAAVIKLLKSKNLFTPLLALLFTAGIMRGAYVKNTSFGPYLDFENEKATLLGEIVSLDPKSATIKCFSIIKDGAQYPARAKVLVNTTNKPSELDLRDIIAADGIIRLYEQMPYWGGTDNRSFYASKGIFAHLNASKTEIIGKNHKTADILRWGSIARGHIKKTVDAYLPGDEGALVKGVLIGDKEDFSADLSNAFRLSGLSHIVAVSGLHIGIFIVFISFGTSFFASRKLGAFTLLFAVFSYVVIADFQPSILRAAAMAAYGLIMEQTKLRRDSLCALMAATLILSFANPFLIFNIGFILSFLATLGIVLLGGSFTKYQLANAGAAAFLFTAPIVAYSFNTITFAALFTSIVISPLVIMVLLLGLVMCAMPFSGAFISPILFCISYVLILISKFFASIRFLAFDVPSPGFITLVCCFCGLYLLYFLLVKKGGKDKIAAAAILMSLLLIGNVAANGAARKNAEITFIATKYANGVYIKSPNCYNIIVGGSGWYDIADFLRKRNIKNLNAVILTSGKNANTLNYLTDKIKVSTIYIPRGVNLNTKDSKICLYDKLQPPLEDGVIFEPLCMENGSADLKIICHGISAVFAEKIDFTERLEADIVFIASENQKNALSTDYIVLGAQYKPEFAPLSENERTKTLKMRNIGSVTFRLDKKGISSVEKTRTPFY